MTFSLNWQSRNTRVQKIINLGIFIAVSSVIQLLENVFFPSSLPFRPGFANVITIIIVAMYGLPEAVLTAAARTTLAAMVTGKLLGFPFFLSFAGGIVSAAVMGIFYNRFKELGIVGVSILGAISHNFTQLAVIYFLLIRNPGVFNMISWLWLSALITGAAVGFLGKAALNITIINKLVKQGRNKGTAVKTNKIGR